MIDGLWLRFGLSQEGLSLAEAKIQMDAMLNLHLGAPGKGAGRVKPRAG
jgi:hypothetical protein